MDDFETQLASNRNAVERIVRFRIQRQADAEDVLQEVYLTAYQKYAQLQNKDAFKGWLLSIARNKCTDYFRKMAAQLELPMDALTETQLSASRFGPTEVFTVRETLSLLGDKDQQILYLYFWKELPQAEIAKQLGIPLGTVKSRLYTAKQNFKNKYPYPAKELKGDHCMKKMPERMLEYTIEASPEAPFSVKWEELMGWLLVPKLGEKLSWGMYDMPSRKKTWQYDMAVLGEAEVHGIRGVEMEARPRGYDPTGCSNPSDDLLPTRLVAQLTDTHCRFLACTAVQNGVKRMLTFLDGDDFLLNWGFGEDNCGNETNLVTKGEICRIGDNITTTKVEPLLDIVGRYTITIGGRRYDTVCVMDVEDYISGAVTEQFLDKNGKTILWRRFNRDDWAIDHYGKKWSELLPENDRLTVNGTTYVEWYDCITDYII